MKLVITILQWLSFILLIGHLFIWFLSYGSGHNISKEIDTAFIRNITILILLIFSLHLWKRRINKM